MTEPSSGPSSSGLAVTAVSPFQLSQQHEDVSRTVSDTLAAEFNEYVCVHNPSFQRLAHCALTLSNYFIFLFFSPLLFKGYRRLSATIQMIRMKLLLLSAYASMIRLIQVE